MHSEPVPGGVRRHTIWVAAETQEVLQVAVAMLDEDWDPVAEVCEVPQQGEPEYQCLARAQDGLAVILLRLGHQPKLPF